MSIAAGAAVPGPWRSGRLSVLAAGGSVVLGGLAVLSPAMTIGLVFGATFVVVAFRSLTAGLLLFTVLIFLEYVLDAYGLAMLIKLGGGVLAAAWAAQLIARPSEGRLLLRDRPFVSAALIGLVIWAFASSLWAADGTVATSSAVRLAQGILFVFIVYAALRKLRDVRWLLGAYVVGATLTAVLAFLSIGGSGRLGRNVGNPNELAAFFLPAVILCAFTLLGERRPLVRLGASAAGLVLLVAVLLTGSRGGLIGLTIALSIAVVAAGPARLRMAAAVLVIFGGVGAYYLTAASPQQVERLESLREDRGTGRADLWEVAFEAARDRPLTGVGAGNFPVVEAQYAAQEVSIERIDLVLDKSKVVHNTYLGFLSQLGLVGLAAFAFAAVAALGSGLQAVRRLRGAAWQFQLPIRGFLVGLIGMLVTSTFASAEYEKQLWLLLGVAFALPAITARPQGSGPASADRSSIAATSHRPDATLSPVGADYHQRVHEEGAEGQSGATPAPGGRAAADPGRLARREAALVERERTVTRRERELRQHAMDRQQLERALAAERRAAALQRERLLELEARIAQLESGLAADQRPEQAAPPVEEAARDGSLG